MKALLTLVLAAVLLVMPAQGAQAEKCMSFSELNAERVRALQSGLMVAALKCVHKPHLELRPGYNAFVTRYERELIGHSNVLQDYFRRTYGAGHRAKLNAYVSALANTFSVRTFDYPSFCEDMAALSQHLMTQEDGAVRHVRFDMSKLPPSYAPLCAAEQHPDFPRTRNGLPDLASVHVPDLDRPLMRQAQVDP